MQNSTSFDRDTLNLYGNKDPAKKGQLAGYKAFLHSLQ